MSALTFLPPPCGEADAGSASGGDIVDICPPPEMRLLRSRISTSPRWGRWRRSAASTPSASAAAKRQ